MDCVMPFSQQYMRQEITFRFEDRTEIVVEINKTVHFFAGTVESVAVMRYTIINIKESVCGVLSCPTFQ